MKHFPVGRVDYLAIILVLTGCAGMPPSDVALSAVDRAQIKNIKIRSDGKMPEKMMLYLDVGPPLVGAGMAEHGHSDEKSLVIDTMKRNDIDLPAILKSEFQNAVRARADLNLIEDRSPADAELALTVNIYGLYQYQGWRLAGRPLYPILNVTASLRRVDGNVIWQKTEFVSAVNRQNNVSSKFDFYIRNPEHLRRAFTNVAAIVSRMLVDDLLPPK
jgi:hypothetical protein